MKSHKIYCILFVFLLVTAAFGKPHAEDTAAVLPSHSIDAEKRQTMITIVAESEQEYMKGIDAYDLGDKKKAQKYFRNALKKLASARFDHNFLYGLSDYFERMYRELNNRLNLLETSNQPYTKIPSIPIYPDNPMVQKYLRIFSSNPSRRSIIRAFERMGRYKDMVSKILNEYGLPEELIYLPIVESRYSVGDVSHAGAVGLWQFMKHTGRAYDMRADFWVDERRNPEKSTRAAARYLKNLYFWFNDWHLALAAYNRGENGIGRDLSFSRATGFSDLAKHDAIPTETERYVPQFMACVIISQDPLKYGIEFEYDKPQEYDIYEAETMIDLEIIAQCTRSTLKEIKNLNPSLRAWCTPKNYPKYKLKIPLDTKDFFIQELAKVDNLCPAREFVRYKVKKGDILGRIASRYHTSVRTIMRSNRIKNDRLLMPGKVLIIKPGKKYYRK